MITWIFLLIPVVVAVLLLVFWTKSVVWWEIALLLIPSSLIILLMNTIMVKYNTSDTEYLGSYITSVNYYEAWNERVPCRHPIYCTNCTGSGKSRTCRTYVCGHVHTYDVDFHPEYWTKANNFKKEFDISRSQYEVLKNRFSTKEYFTELNRDYHTIDGDMYSVDWDKDPLKSSTVTEEGYYENKICASHSIFKFQNITDKDKKRWKLYDYPLVSGGHQSVVLGKKVSGYTERKLQYINGYYGPHKQFRIFILFFTDQSFEAAQKQKSYWEGGNKNEFVVCIGIDSKGAYQWCDAFSWMDKPKLEVAVEDYFNSTKDVSLSNFSDWMPSQIQSSWKRKNFEDFKYLQIELTETQLWWVMMAVMVYNVCISVWVVRNEYGNVLSNANHSLYSKLKDLLSHIWIKFKTIRLK